MGKLDGKVALITGSGRNIGRATALKFAGEGAHVVVNARANQQEAESVAREVRDLGVKAVPILADVGSKRRSRRWRRRRCPNSAGSTSWSTTPRSGRTSRSPRSPTRIGSGSAGSCSTAHSI